MSGTRIVCLFSVPGTGTTFVERFVETLPGVGNAVELAALAKNPFAFRDPFTGLQGFVPGTVNLVKSHLAPEHERAARIYASLFPAVVPLREPLASLISRRARHPQATALHVVEQWIVLVSKLATLERQPFWLPVDLLGTQGPATRRRVMLDLCSHLGFGGVELYLAQIASAWRPENASARTGLHEMYRVRDIKALEKAMPAEIAALRRVDGLLRPFLHAQEYTDEDLFWWRHGPTTTRSTPIPRSGCAT